MNLDRFKYMFPIIKFTLHRTIEVKMLVHLVKITFGTRNEANCVFARP